MHPVNGPENGFSSASFWLGVRRASPVMLGYLPISFAFGVLAAQAGLSALEAGLMGLLVFAGSAQFIAVNLLLAGVSPLSIVATTFVVNARHALMSAALVPFLRGWSRKEQILFSYGMSDETFMLNIGRFSEHGVVRDEAFGVNLASYSIWVLSGVLGALSGKLIGDMRPWGLDFALTGVFIALLMPYCRFRRELAAAAIAGTVSILLYLNGVEQWNVIIATVAAASLALLLPLDGGSAAGRNAGGKAGARACKRPDQLSDPQGESKCS